MRFAKYVFATAGLYGLVTLILGYYALMVGGAGMGRQAPKEVSLSSVGGSSAVCGARHSYPSTHAVPASIRGGAGSSTEVQADSVPVPDTNGEALIGS